MQSAFRRAVWGEGVSQGLRVKPATSKRFGEGLRKWRIRMSDV